MVTSPFPAGVVTGHLAAVLGVDTRRIDPDLPLTALGLQPWTAVLLRDRLRAADGVDVPLRRLLDGGSARAVARLVDRRTFRTPPAHRPGADPDPPGVHLVPLDAVLVDRLTARARDHGLALAQALAAAATLTLARWSCGTAPLELTVGGTDAPGTVRLSGPDPLHWSGFAAYARDLRAVAPPAAGPVVRLGLGAPLPRAGGDRLEYLLVVDPSGPGPYARWERRGAVPEQGGDPLTRGLGTAYATLLAALSGTADAWLRTDLGWDPTFAFREPLTARPFPAAGPQLDAPARAAARRAPDAPALLGASGSLSHGALADRAGGIARLLHRAGVRAGSTVAVTLPKGFDQIAAVLAVARQGAVYVPVDPAWPGPRIAAVCRRADIAYAVVAPGVRPGLPPEVTEVPIGPDPEPDPAEAAGVSGEPSPDTGAAPDSPAYVIFTSGSTGEPKGVVVDHAAARVTVDDITDRLGVGPRDRVLGLSALSFDLSVYDIFGVLGAGGALVLPEPDGERDPQHWLDLVERHRVTLWNTAPALMQMLLDLAESDPGGAARQLASLRCVLLSGDWIPVTLPDRLRALVPGVQVISAGGATEAAIWSICQPVGTVSDHWRSIPYGRPLRGQSFHILDDEGRPVPVGCAGELHIAGQGLARGYAGDEEQTAARFPVHPALGERLYRTGDLGLWRTDGAIEFLGRKDRQVKIRGHRIELGEIESVLDRLPAVRRAVASVDRAADGRARLVAHAALAPEALARDAAVVRDELRDALRNAVPAYMVPQRIVLTDALPVTANGKIDHARLPELTDHQGGAGSAGPR
ncbi:amino acid adenylation domain-containing protein [Streptomyces griseoviridis]|uniref:amino acid adenylation domain-containing protein n=1 Tax=Streptomyces griseoviridis TaxID=45398 RepID=UPI00167943F4|nr:amino acid adenylation domain-containing protein [Streptomyces niveoruber]